MKSNILSIIIPVYNSEKYLKECIDSIISQNNNIFELLLIENGSTDHSKEICDEYADKFNFIKAFHIPNKGVSNARNYGIEHSSGEWITFIDSDDFISPEYIQSIEPFLNTDTDLITFNYVRYINEQKKESGNLTITEGKHQSTIELFKLAVRLEVSALSVCLSIYKNSIIKNNDLKFNEEMKTCEDFMFSLSYYNYITQYNIINKNLYYYRLNPFSTTSIRSLQHANNYQIVFNTVVNIIKDKNIDNKNILIFKERWTKWIIGLIYNYKSQKITDELIKEFVYTQTYYKLATKFKSKKIKLRFERFLLINQMNSCIFFYCKCTDLIKKIIKRYKI